MAQISLQPPVRISIIVEKLIVAKECSVFRQTLGEEMEYNGDSGKMGIQEITVVNGVVEAFINNHSDGIFRKEQSFIIPTALGR